MCELCQKSHSKFGTSAGSALRLGRWQGSLRCLGTGCRVPGFSANKVYLPQHLILLPKVPQGCVHNLSQEQLHAHRTQAQPLHIYFRFWMKAIWN